MRTVSVIAMAIAVSGCSVPRASSAEIVSGNKDTVSVKAGRDADPGALAEEHCKKFGKEAVLRDVELLLFSSVYRFTCA